MLKITGEQQRREVLSQFGKIAGGGNGLVDKELMIEFLQIFDEVDDHYEKILSESNKKLVTSE